MQVILFIIIYLTGCFFSYIKVKHSDFIAYTKHQIAYKIIFSVLSWVGIVIAMQLDKDYDSTEKWPSIDKKIINHYKYSTTEITEKEHGAETVFSFTTYVFTPGEPMLKPHITLTHIKEDCVSVFVEQFIDLEEKDVDYIIDNLCGKLKEKLNDKETAQGSTVTTELMSDLFKSIIISEIKYYISITKSITKLIIKK